MKTAGTIRKANSSTDAENWLMDCNPQAAANIKLNNTNTNSQRPMIVDNLRRRVS